MLEAGPSGSWKFLSHIPYICILAESATRFSIPGHPSEYSVCYAATVAATVLLCRVHA
jgi:hypothetical protein